MGPGFVTPDANTIWEHLLRKGIKTYEFKTLRVKNEYSYRIRKEMTINYKLSKAEKYHKHP